MVKDKCPGAGQALGFESNIDELAKSRICIEFVIPAKAGIQGSR
jgi:hypothetical protein